MSILFIGCSTTDPEFSTTGNLTLILEDASCTEAWLKISGDFKGEAILKRDDKEALRINLSSSDTIIVDDSLLPNKSYAYKLYNNENRVLSNTIKAITMDTTSHNFNWEIFTFGDGIGGFSSLYDCAIISEDNIYCVGEIKFWNDSLKTPYMYNTLKWNGTWELKTTPYKYNGQELGGPIRAIYAFTENNIWFGIGNLIHWDGTEYEPVNIEQVFSSLVSKIWRTNNGDIYITGSEGKIAKYNGQSWKKINSNTTLLLVDIFGKKDVYVCGISSGGGIIMKSSGDSFTNIAESRIVPADQVFYPYLYGSIRSIWMDEKNSLYAVGAYLYRHKLGIWEYLKGLPGNIAYDNLQAQYRGFITGIRGNTSNDLWVCGERNTLMHFNGATWKQIGLPYSSNSEIIWNTIEVKGNIVIVVGSVGRKAIIMMIKR